MGHYAQVRFNPELNAYHLLRRIDSNKDKIYLLCQLNQSQLSKTLFSIGHLTKTEVRKIAREQNLITADKKDSTGICFIGESNFEHF
ncbi:tRNA-specific 2-thiouridylase mnmA [Ooceraea biroi]|uniref:tRNA-specific 2-thiouridylase mnmA n=1 Tax=Ooceraea biroi TaxID=2015173 RepID=A0A026WGU3_OOCBI|nr:tRNA-specific 2-thiouridylase mnmA [Ooceraea biroi]